MAAGRTNMRLYDDIVDKARTALNLFAQDLNRIASIAFPYLGNRAAGT
jgi:hypothetical protein